MIGKPARWLEGFRRYVLFSAAAHLLWEIGQLALFTLWYEDPAWQIAWAVGHCTVGDVMIAAASLALALWLIGSPRWSAIWSWRTAVAATAMGVGYTIYSEWVNTNIWSSWAYADSMPRLPWIGTGLAPLLQWIIIPPLGYWLCFANQPRGGKTCDP
jgi:hypothetical protein